MNRVSEFGCASTLSLSLFVDPWLTTQPAQSRGPVINGVNLLDSHNISRFLFLIDFILAYGLPVKKQKGQQTS